MKPVTTEVTEISTKLATIDLANVKVSGSYATGKATPESDVDILIGLTDAEWERVTPQNPPEILTTIFQIVPEEKLDIKLYKLSDRNDMWMYRRGRITPSGKGISGAFVLVRQMKLMPEELIRNLWREAVEPTLIPHAGRVAKPSLSKFELYNTQYSLKQLQELAKTAGLSPSGLKQDLIDRLVKRGVLK